MIVERLKGGPWGQNAFLVANGSQAMVIDPGGSADSVLAVLAERKLQLVAILNTHGHFDHIGAVQPLIDATGARFHISAREVPIMKSSNMLRFIFKSKDKVIVPTEFIDLDCLPEHIEVAGLTVTCIRTPGHTPGGHCFLIDDHLFSGDTVLRAIPGSSSLPGGDAAALARSIERLAQLPPQTLLHPGHGRDTSLGEALEALRTATSASGDTE
jgi:glyoxylase-like metal-dependent hydrolase (beta-lactamase superfamily II)